MLHFSFSRYSGLSGACWPSPAGLSWSHWVASPRGLRHCPAQSGYFDSSCAVASGIGIVSAASSATAKIERLSNGIWDLPGKVSDFQTQDRAQRTPVEGGRGTVELATAPEPPGRPRWSGKAWRAQFPGVLK